MSRESGICLALTCKSLLSVSTLAIHHRPTLPPENRIPFSDFQDAIFHSGNPEHRSRRTMIDFLFRIHPLGDRVRRSPAVNLCQDCLRYRPTEPSWWAGKGAPCPGKAEIGRCWSLMVEHWRYKQVLQCPECWYANHMAVCEGCRERDGSEEREGE